MKILMKTYKKQKITMAIRIKIKIRTEIKIRFIIKNSFMNELVLIKK